MGDCISSCYCFICKPLPRESVYLHPLIFKAQQDSFTRSLKRCLLYYKLPSGIRFTTDRYPTILVYVDSSGVEGLYFNILFRTSSGYSQLKFIAYFVFDTLVSRCVSHIGQQILEYHSLGTLKLFTNQLNAPPAIIGEFLSYFSSLSRPCCGQHLNSPPRNHSWPS